MSITQQQEPRFTFQLFSTKHSIFLSPYHQKYNQLSDQNNPSDLFLCTILTSLLQFQDVFQLHTPGGGGYGRADATRTTPGLSDGKDKDVGTSTGLPRTFESGKPGGNKTFVERGSVFEYRQAQESV